ncbi:MAG: stage 0 sporulation protein, partial [Bacilli bacterium]
MIKVIGVKFKSVGKVYYFDPLEFDINKGDNVIVETARGLEYGSVTIGVTMVEDKDVIQPLKQVVRIATEDDAKVNEENKSKKSEALKI